MVECPWWIAIFIRCCLRFLCSSPSLMYLSLMRTTDPTLCEIEELNLLMGSFTLHDDEESKAGMIRVECHCCI